MSETIPDKKTVVIPAAVVDAYLAMPQLGTDGKIHPRRHDQVAERREPSGEKKRIGPDVVTAALALRRSHQQAPALDVLDLVMKGCTGSLSDFGEDLHPTSPFGQIIASAFDRGMEPGDWKLIDRADSQALRAELQRIWWQEILPKFAFRYSSAI